VSGDVVTRLGIIGCGRIAQAYAEAASDSTTVRIAAVADVNGAAAAEFAAPLGAAVYHDHLALIGSGAIDGVLIATPPSTHVDVALDAIAFGIPTLCEKPFALRPADASKMVHAAREAGVLLTMASKYRYVADVARATQLVKAGLIGDPIQADVCFAGHVDMSSRWNSDPTVSGGGVLIDNGAHAVDLIRSFLGPIETVLATADDRRSTPGVEDTAIVVVRLVSGTLATIRLSWSYDSMEPAFLTLYGDTGALRLGWGESSYRGDVSGEWHTFGHGYDKVRALRSQLEEFGDAIDSGRPLRITDEDALASVCVIDAAYRSLDSGTWAVVEHPSLDVEVRLPSAS